MDFLDGKPLINQKKRIIVANEALNKANIIVFLFTAGWCSHSVELINKLIQIYEVGKALEMHLEIVNVPNDATLKDFMEDFKTHGNWFSLIYGDSIAQELIWMFNVIHLPSLVVTDYKGSIITKNGYSEIMKIGINVLVTWQT